MAKGCMIALHSDSGVEIRAILLFSRQARNLEALGRYVPNGSFRARGNWDIFPAPKGCFRHASLADLNFTRSMLEVQIFDLHLAAAVA